MSEPLTKEKLLNTLGNKCLSPLELAQQLGCATSKTVWDTSDEFRILLSTLVSRNEVVFDNQWGLCASKNI